MTFVLQSTSVVLYVVAHGIGQASSPSKLDTHRTQEAKREREEEKRETLTPEMMGGRTIADGNEEGWPGKESDEKDRSKGCATTEE